MSTNRSVIPASWILGIFAFFAIVGVGIQIWLASVPVADMNAAHQKLAFNGNWLFILSVGVIAGFALGWLSRRNDG